MNKVRANQIAAKALQTRKKHLNAGVHTPICPYNLADAMGFDIRFVNIPSFEGMYLADEGIILISAARPEGRKRFTCAHEIGHHVLGHGTVIDEIIETGSDKEIELEADLFAGMLLMPSSAIKRVTKDADIEISTIDSKQAYILSKYFGLSYTGFLTQLCFNLKLINHAHYRKLKKSNLGSIKSLLCPIVTKNQVIVIGEWWLEKAIDIEVGDIIIAENICSIEGELILKENKNKMCNMYEAIKPGIAKITDNNWVSFVRISRKKYSGIYQFRHEEEAE